MGLVYEQSRNRELYIIVVNKQVSENRFESTSIMNEALIAGNSIPFQYIF